MKYKHKPIVVDAVQYPNDKGYPAWFVEAILNADIYTTSDDNLEIETPEGIMKSSNGDYVIKGTKGEFYFCKPDIFEESYDINNNGELKTCPCCGGETTIVQEHNYSIDDSDELRWIECDKCGLRTREFSEKNEQEMIDTWNKRMGDNDD